MNFAIKLLHERRHGAIRKIDGYSGKIYVFKWHEGVKAYVHEPAEQAEADDIFRTQGRTTSSYFAPVDLGEATKQADPKLIEHCLRLGIVVSEEDTDETVKRLLAAHDKGVGTERPVRSIYEDAMVRVGLVPAELPERGYHTAEEMERHVADFLNRLTAPVEPPADESGEDAATDGPTPPLKNRRARRERAAAQT